MLDQAYLVNTIYHGIVNQLATFLFLSFTVTANVYNGTNLSFTKISRTDMGAYLCIATNGVPPSVSKRILVDVECKYINKQDICF